MKVLLLLFIACFASQASAQTENPLLALADGPIHDFFQKLKSGVENWASNSALLQTIDINHTLGRIVDIGETQVTDLIFNKLLPWIMSILQRPGSDLRNFLATLRNRLKTLDVKNLTLQLPSLINTITSYMDLIIKAMDQIKNGVDVKVLETAANSSITTATPRGAQTVVTTPRGAQAVVTTTVPPKKSWLFGFK